MIERRMLWNNGNVRSISLNEKKGNHIWHNTSDLPDVYICENNDARKGKFDSRRVSGSGNQQSYLEASVEYQLGDLGVRRIFKIYDDVPAIVNELYLKGNADNMFRGGLPTNPADLKNIESIDDVKREMEHPVIDQFAPGGVHWDMKAVEFFDVTDMCNNLVAERNFIPFRKAFYRGNLLFARDKNKNAGLFFLKTAPCSMVQLAYQGADFCIDFDRFSVIGLGLYPEDINDKEWTKAYSDVIGVFNGGEFESLVALRKYQKTIRRENFNSGEMVMMNTWGDRSQDSKVNETFCIAELEAGSKIGITHFQIDDGWQSGRTPNSATKGGSFKDIWKNPDYWKPNKNKYPNGLKPVVDKAKELNIELGLWFNPSVQDDYADWQKDADVLIGLYKDFGIKVFKIDGLKIPTKNAEKNLRKLFERVEQQTDNQVVINMDVTAGRRGGYHYFNEYGNLFIENRYTDWGIYFPYSTLRNLWMLAKYVPAENLQTVFLNKWRNLDKYVDDRFAPSTYSFEYLFATTMAGQPLAWFEGTGLPQEAFAVRKIIDKYKTFCTDFHSGIILPLGDEPSGESWCGFQSDHGDYGYFIIYREDNDNSSQSIKCNMTPGRKINFEPLLGNGRAISNVVGSDGEVEFAIDNKNDFVVLKYHLAD